MSAGLRSKDRQRAWREKIGLLTIILATMAFVGYLTFGFTNSVCGKPPLRYRTGRIEGGSMIYHGYNYDMDKFIHPPAAGINGGTNPLYDLFAAGGKDGSFLFQTVNEKCLDIITPASGSGIVSQGNRMGWYFPCNLYNQYGTSAVNKTGYAEGRMCHTTGPARTQFRAMKPLGQVYYLWDDLKNSSRNLGVYNGSVCCFSKYCFAVADMGTCAAPSWTFRSSTGSTEVRSTTLRFSTTPRPARTRPSEAATSPRS